MQNLLFELIASGIEADQALAIAEAKLKSNLKQAPKSGVNWQLSKIQLELLENQKGV